MKDENKHGVYEDDGGFRVNVMLNGKLRAVGDLFATSEDAIIAGIKTQFKLLGEYHRDQRGT